MITEQTKKHCSKYKGCIKCPFVGNECVAPHNNSLDSYNKWLDKMQNLIKVVK